MSRSVAVRVVRVDAPAPRKRRRAAARSRWTSLLARLWPDVRTRRKLVRTFHKAPPALKGFVLGLLLVVLAFTVNGIYQVVRKPTELYFP